MILGSLETSQPYLSNDAWLAWKEGGFDIVDMSFTGWSAQPKCMLGARVSYYKEVSVVHSVVPALGGEWRARIWGTRGCWHWGNWACWGAI